MKRTITNRSCSRIRKKTLKSKSLKMVTRSRSRSRSRSKCPHKEKYAQLQAKCETLEKEVNC